MHVKAGKFKQYNLAWFTNRVSKNQLFKAKWKETVVPSIKVGWVVMTSKPKRQFLTTPWPPVLSAVCHGIEYEARSRPSRENQGRGMHLRFWSEDFCEYPQDFCQNLLSKSVCCWPWAMGDETWHDCVRSFRKATTSIHKKVFWFDEASWALHAFAYPTL